jgi:hypothetical protein
MKRTQHHQPSPIPMPRHNHQVCPDCNRPVTGNHTCKPKASTR